MTLRNVPRWRARFVVMCAVLAAQARAADAPAAAPAAGAQTQRQQAIAAAAEALRPRLVEQRRDLHMHPELSNREERTSGIVAQRLKELGLDEIKTGIGKYGVVALLKGARPGMVVAVRADMDALPIVEARDVPYKSQNAGVMHACGHDVHTSVALGVAEVLAGMKKELPGTVKFIFQPAEEGAPAGEEGGAKLMLSEGALRDPEPRAIFALHCMPSIPVGQIGFSYDAALAASDHFTITIHGKKVHGAYPHEGIDAVVVAAQCVLALQTIRSRRIDTHEPIVVTIGSIHGGNRFNIIADEVKLEGTVRTLNAEIRRDVHRLMRETVEGVCASQGATGALTFAGEGNPVTQNNHELAEAVLPSLRAVVGDANVLVRKAQMGAEDFAYFARAVPGFYYLLGVTNPSKGITAMIHTPEFDVDEECLVIGVKVMSNVVFDYLERQ